MKLSLLLSVLTAVIFTSCSTAYKTGQTPDDVYYSPVVEKETNREVVRREEASVDPEQRQIRMQAFDPRWRTLDDRYDYGSRYNPYRYGYNYDYYYNPYFYNFPVYNNSFWPINNNNYWSNFSFINQRNSAPRMTSLSSYNSSKVLNTFNPKNGAVTNSDNYRRYNNSNSQQNTRQDIRPSSDNYSTPSNNNTRTYSPARSTPSSSSSSSGNSGGTPVQRNGRGQ